MYKEPPIAAGSMMSQSMRKLAGTPEIGVSLGKKKAGGPSGYW